MKTMGGRFIRFLKSLLSTGSPTHTSSLAQRLARSSKREMVRRQLERNLYAKVDQLQLVMPKGSTLLVRHWGVDCNGALSQDPITCTTKITSDLKVTLTGEDLFLKTGSTEGRIHLSW